MGAHWVTARRNQETRRRLVGADAGGRPQVRRGHGEDVAVETCHAARGLWAAWPAPASMPGRFPKQCGRTEGFFRR